MLWISILLERKARPRLQTYPHQKGNHLSALSVEAIKTRAYSSFFPQHEILMKIYFHLFIF